MLFDYCIVMNMNCLCETSFVKTKFLQSETDFFFLSFCKFE